MEKINAEDVILSLFILGFEKIDILLYICTLTEISLNQEAKFGFDFSDSDLSSKFCQDIFFDGVFFKLREQSSIDVIYQKRNSKLLMLLEKMNFKKIVKMKIDIILEDQLLNYNNFFSDKELEFLDNIKELALNK